MAVIDCVQAVNVSLTFLFASILEILTLLLANISFLGSHAAYFVLVSTCHLSFFDLKQGKIIVVALRVVK